jgi:hypothetical protein
VRATWAATRDATQAATRGATDAATSAATAAATWAAIAAATWAAIAAATEDATSAATRDATSAATTDATGDATRVAIDAATEAATEAVTWATHAATRAATVAATVAATEAATATEASPLVSFLLNCCSRWSVFYASGNMWSGWVAYLSFFRHVARLELPQYESYQHYEAATIHGGPRFMHRKFCIVADRPTVCLKDDANRPHCATGPHLAWRDGRKLYAWHGVSVPAEWIETPEVLTPAMALTWPNAEQRRAAVEILGWEKVLAELKPKVIDSDVDPMIGDLLQVDLPDAPGEQFLRVRCGTGRSFCLPVPKAMKTALEANAWTWGDDVKAISVRDYAVRT